MGEIAADRAAVADRLVRDLADRLREKRRVPRDKVRTLDVDMPGERADVQNAVPHLDAAQLGQSADIDESFGGEKPHVHGRHQALAACDEPRRTGFCGEGRACLFERGDPQIIERRRFHALRGLPPNWRHEAPRPPWRQGLLLIER